MDYRLANDGFSPKLVEKAIFDGKYEMPLIKKEKIPEIKILLPFDKKNSLKGKKENDATIHFYIFDSAFKRIVNHPEKYKDELSKFNSIISPDFSIYRDMPLATQISNTYLNRAIGAYYQSNGIKVIPNIRWGDSRTYSFCFDGVEKNGTYAIGTYGTLKKKVDRYYFEKGLEVFFKKLEPETVYIYGAMPDKIFSKYQSKAKLINIKPYIATIFEGEKNGCRE